jgi:hypothetical protein
VGAAKPVDAEESSFERAFRARWMLPDAAETEPAVNSVNVPARSAMSTEIEAPAPRLSMPSTFDSERASAEAEAAPGVPLHPALTDRFFFGVGAFYASSTTEARLNSPSGIGTSVAFEDVLGLDNSKAVPQGLARWRMSDRWRLELEYFELNRSNTKQIGEDITWWDQVFPSGASLDTTFDVSVVRASVGYSFFKRPDKEFGIALGFHLTDIGVELSGGGGNADSGDLLAPLPVISLYGQVALTDIWAFSGRVDAFRVAYSPYEGHIYSIGIDALCHPWRHVGFGLGFRSLEMELSASSHDWEGAVRSVYSGPIAFLSASF